MEILCQSQEVARLAPLKTKPRLFRRVQCDTIIYCSDDLQKFLCSHLTSSYVESPHVGHHLSGDTAVAQSCQAFLGLPIMYLS